MMSYCAALAQLRCAVCKCGSMQSRRMRREHYVRRYTKGCLIQNSSGSSRSSKARTTVNNSIHKDTFTLYWNSFLLLGWTGMHRLLSSSFAQHRLCFSLFSLLLLAFLLLQFWRVGERTFTFTTHWLSCCYWMRVFHSLRSNRIFSFIQLCHLHYTKRSSSAPLPPSLALFINKKSQFLFTLPTYCCVMNRPSLYFIFMDTKHIYHTGDVWRHHSRCHHHRITLAHPYTFGNKRVAGMGNNCEVNEWTENKRQAKELYATHHTNTCKRQNQQNQYYTHAIHIFGGGIAAKSMSIWKKNQPYSEHNTSIGKSFSTFT